MLSRLSLDNHLATRQNILTTLTSDLNGALSLCLYPSDRVNDLINIAYWLISFYPSDPSCKCNVHFIVQISIVYFRKTCTYFELLIEKFVPNIPTDNIICQPLTKLPPSQVRKPLPFSQPLCDQHRQPALLGLQ